ncbi:hypothetical protein [Amycolatopsis sp. NPDC050768]|uniref:hypothetical protein n=1 Tax=Amycolatopsis sp. NPDC050768 TaxID=3154839 RepID=UPI0034049631
MAKTQIPGFKTGGGLLRKVIGCGVAIALLILIIRYPADAANWAHGAAATVGDAIDGLVAFFRGLAN